ncbi:hypothetical protein LL254_18845, partial [Marinobacter nauticus]|uniref:hypothetical protein n=1 Tax=Marinobacter nauticus TaxID=2743 RepID=UPI001D186A71
MLRAEVPEEHLLQISNTGTKSPKRPERMAEHLNHENRPVDGRDKNYRTQALGMTRNRVFLQPR